MCIRDRMNAYPCGNYPVFEGYDHMQYQIRDPKGFAEMLALSLRMTVCRSCRLSESVRTRYDIIEIGRIIGTIINTFIYISW